MLGIIEGGWAPNVPNALKEAATHLQHDFVSVEVDSITTGQSAADLDERITCFGPTLTYLRPAATSTLTQYSDAGVKFLNPIDAAEIADDKAATYSVLQAAGVPQVDSILCEPELAQVQHAVETIGFPAIVKRAVGGQGRWVRLVESQSACEQAMTDFATEDPATVLVQPFIQESPGESIRVIVLGEQILASTVRRAKEGQWVSNIAQGGSQETYPLNTDVVTMCTEAVRAIGLGFAGVDLLNTNTGAQVLEVNACPDFTSMKDYSAVDIAQEIVKATLAL